MTASPGCAGANQVAKYDDLIDEASGELDRVEAQLHLATQELLSIQGDVSKLSLAACAATKRNQQVSLEHDHAMCWLNHCLCTVLQGACHCSRNPVIGR